MKWLNQFDEMTTRQIKKLPAGLRPLMMGVSWLGEPIIVLSIGFVSFALSVKQGLSIEAKALALAGASFLICILLKFVLHRRRPHNLKVESFGFRSYSFPSGHAFGPVIFYGMIAYLDFVSLPTTLSYVLVAGLCLLVLLIGVSRVYLNIHYPSDVIGGWLLGFAFLVAIITSLP
jgi:undecaprenyl-diphosphatase